MDWLDRQIARARRREGAERWALLPLVGALGLSCERRVRAGLVPSTSRAKVSTPAVTATRRSTPSPITCRHGPTTSPATYWDAADLYERANGRLYVSADFALPRDLSTEEQIALAREFAQELTKDGSLPVHACDSLRAATADGSRAQPARAPDDLRAEERRDRPQPGAVVLACQSDRPRPRAAPRRRVRSTDTPGWNTRATRWADLTNKTLAKPRTRGARRPSQLRASGRRRRGRGVTSVRPPPAW